MQLSPLSRGVTGFFEPDPDTAPTFGAAEFTAACHQIMRPVGGRVLCVDTDLTARNYFAAAVDLGGRPLSILCNTTFAFVAFVQGHAVGFVRLQFLEEAGLAEAFHAVPPFRPLASDWLEAAVSMDDLGQLAEIERDQARYWIRTGFARNGDVVFNCWD